ncbi:FBP domain-containing protein [Kocuria turfanensis]|uniref:Elongation factor G-binding protein C-terminal treble-clef zinc-finger domain-containing protein n=1 Tax=Kocuria turfanensis TaxID=388357 RepID=A0A512I9K1_9MICC|nr:FBP domain-containing protein [Kocuria turfanensis]GEO94378.1 hypothetical protein KTU01_05010 [Kocuria turfanensis]
MHPLTEAEIRSSLINCSRKDAARLPVPPDLGALDWDRLDYLGWRDPQSPRRGFAVVPTEQGPKGIVVQTSGAAGAGKQAMCAWCQDVRLPHPVVMYVARRAGAAGREGSTVGTLVCAGFQCSANVRKRPPSPYKGFDMDAYVADRIAGLRERSRGFVAAVDR